VGGGARPAPAVLPQGVAHWACVGGMGPLSTGEDGRRGRTGQRSASAGRTGDRPCTRTSDLDAARRWVEDSCTRQGLPAKVADPNALRSIAVMLTAGRVPMRLEAPRGADSGGVEVLRPRTAGLTIA
jgi:hypothetical protein